MNKLFVLPNAITTFGLACGLFIIFKMSMLQNIAQEPALLNMVVLLLLVACVADVLDGAIARAVKAESDFGLFFDSISDAVTFGVAPSVIVLKTFNLPPDAEWAFFINASAMVYSICGILRLVRFSVIDTAKNTQAPPIEVLKGHFNGLPIPAAAICAVSLNLLLSSEYIQISELLRVKGMTLGLTVLGYLMLSKLKFPSLKALEIKLPSFPLVFFVVLASVFFFYGLFYHLHATLFILSWGYVLGAMGYNGFKKRQNP